MSRSASPRLLAWQKLPFRARPDVEIYPLERGGRRVWGVKDPWTLRYFEFGEEERFVLDLLDGHRTAAEICRRFDEHFAPRHLTDTELRAFIVRMHRQGLVASDLPGQGSVLRERQLSHGRQDWLALLANPLVIRFRGLDPQPALDWLYPKVRYLYSPLCLAACLALMIVALGIVGWNFEEIGRRLPEFDTFWTPVNVVWLGIALAVAKVLHELGHALTCKHFGGECHELGLLLLVFTPCLYCNVSDAWRLPNKWQRVAIDSAGMIVEGTLAALCTLFWWWSEPGPLEATCLNMMFVCSISTFVFNANPLLRYDGYYLLSDLLEIPNLAQEATEALRWSLAGWFLGPQARDVRLGPSPGWWLSVYAALSLAYRAVVVVGFIWLAHRVLAPWGLDLLVWLLVASMLIAPATTLWNWALRPDSNLPIDRFRLLVRGGAVALAVVALLSIPFPYRPSAPVVVEPRGARSIYATIPGRLISVVKAGARVEAGEQVGRLENLELERELAQLRGEYDAQQLHVRNLERRRISDQQAGELLPAARESLVDLKQRLTQKEHDFERLRLMAPVAGTVLPPVNRREDGSPGSLSSWQGTPLDPDNAGCFVEAGTLVCRIGNPAELEAWAVVDQADVEGMHSGQAVRLVFDEQPGIVLRGQVVEVGAVDLEITPRELIAQQQVDSRPDQRGVAHPRNASYQARIEFEPANRPLAIGSAGQARIDVGWRSLSWRLGRIVNRSFRIDW